MFVYNDHTSFPESIFIYLLSLSFFNTNIKYAHTHTHTCKHRITRYFIRQQIDPAGQEKGIRSLLLSINKHHHHRPVSKEKRGREGGGNIIEIIYTLINMYSIYYMCTTRVHVHVALQEIFLIYFCCSSILYIVYTVYINVVSMCACGGVHEGWTEIN